MMFGFRDKFGYSECMKCESLQIDVMPAELGRYYPGNYYSLSNGPVHRSNNPLIRFLVKKRNSHLLGELNLIGLAMSKLKPNHALDLLIKLGVKRHHRILDVGCGTGSLLSTMAGFGYLHLEGVDPFVEADIRGDGYRIQKAQLREVSRQFDVVMFHHSLEHVFDPIAELSHVGQILSPGGMCIVRIPMPSSEAWKTYQEHWVNLDAPRHLALLSRRGMVIAAGKASLRINQTMDDSSAFQFWGSEQYLKDIPLFSPTSYAVSPSKSIFSPEQIEKFSQKAKDLNSQSRGDWTVFVLGKA
jgi:SAM-dependent methyltransferase